MAEIRIDDTILANFYDKIAVITGCAQGIGERAVRQLFQAGARVVAADVNDIKGQSVVDTLQHNGQKGHLHATYVHVDVSNYDSVHALFKHALHLHGRVDMVIHCAAITEIGGWFAPGKNMDSIIRPPTTQVLDINLAGTMYVTHVALTAMRPDSSTQNGDDKSITLVSSVAGFKESPGLFAYSASKHGVMGLMRSLRGYLPSTFNVRINVICPWATDTEMLGAVRDLWLRNSMPINMPDDVARIILQCAGDESLHGKAVYVAGGKGFDIEEGFDRTQAEWLGADQSRDLAKGQELLGSGSAWAAK
ncbi:hypothetical protein NM208_g4180 [Fusarium decemcellulare]|uniref:Uncharacterized protein n=1 Tax=Fusarium decemcellulare TaxID=57161 RepID=A0ACC1SLS0_9HYPO|nr:hypothetical protein NM208_g4180 [Fusarium decemcellulare]